MMMSSKPARNMYRLIVKQIESKYCILLVLITLIFRVMSQFVLKITWYSKHDNFVAWYGVM